MKRIFILLISLLTSAVGFSQCEQDSINPWFENFNPEPTISCGGDLSTLIPTAHDECDTLVEIAIYEETYSGSCPGNYDVFRIYRAFDDNGNGVIESQMIHVVDETGPQISGVLDLIEVDCNSSYTISQPSFSDDCSGISETDLNVESYINSNNLEESVYIWSATDGCGNISYAQTTVRYVDSVNPWFENFPDDVTINCTDSIPPVLYPQVFDSCDTYLPIEYAEEYVYGNCPSNYDIIRTFSAYDDSGNPVIDSQVIHVVDNVAPEFGNMTTEVVEMCGYSQPSPPAVWDNCGTVSLSWEVNTIDSISICNYTSIITWAATDNCGNTSYVSQAFQVMDVIPPTITGEIEIDLLLGTSIDTIMVEYADNCSEVSITYVDMEVSGGNIIRLYTATDECGNSSTFEQIIHFYSDGGGGGNNRVAICHRTGNGSYHTIYVAPQAVQAHLAHGDYLGPCTEMIIDWQSILPNSDLEMRVIKGYDNKYKKFVKTK
jgi:hypothetical protein